MKQKKSVIESVKSYFLNRKSKNSKDVDEHEKLKNELEQKKLLGEKEGKYSD
jgi:hypothetical protein